jgi:hypothetical protein
MANNDDIQVDLNQDQGGQVLQNVPARAQTTLAFRVDQSKISEFWGQKAKDTVTAIVFIRKIEDLSRTNHLTDTATYANVANALKALLGSGSLQQLTCSTGRMLSSPGRI